MNIQHPPDYTVLLLFLELPRKLEERAPDLAAAPYLHRPRSAFGQDWIQAAALSGAPMQERVGGSGKTLPGAWGTGE